MTTLAWRQELAPVAAICGVYLLFLVLVPPTGEFPSTDDFDYAASAWHLAETGDLRLSDWPAMTLIGHVAWGGLFAAVGGSSFLTLRLSMFALSALTALTLYAWTRRYGHSRALAVWFGVTFALNPLTVSLQYTFMTDVTGVALTALLLLLAPPLDAAGSRQCFGYGTLAGLAYLTRETAAIPFLLYGGLAFWHTHRRKELIRSFLCLVAPFAAMVVGYLLWLHMLHGVPSNRTISMIDVGSGTHHLRRLYRISTLFGLRMFPVSVLLLSRPGRFQDRRAWIFAIVLVVVVIGLTLSIGGGLPPAFGDDLFDLGIRAPELSGEYQPAGMRGPEIRWDGRPISLFRLLTDLATLVSLVALIQWLISQRRIDPALNGLLRRRMTLAGLTFLATLSLMLVVGTYMSRYSLTLMVPAMMGIAGLLSAGTSPRQMQVAWLTTCLVGLLSLIGIQDGMQRSRAFWSAVDVVHQRGVEPAAVDAGLAYAGFHRFNPHYRGAENAGPFLNEVEAHLGSEEYSAALAAISPATITSDLPIQISFRKELGFRVLTTTKYQSWFRSGDVYVLFDESRDPALLPVPIQRWLLESQSRQSWSSAVESPTADQ